MNKLRKNKLCLLRALAFITAVCHHHHCYNYSYPDRQNPPKICKDARHREDIIDSNTFVKH